MISDFHPPFPFRPTGTASQIRHVTSPVFQTYARRVCGAWRLWCGCRHSGFETWDRGWGVSNGRLFFPSFSPFRKGVGDGGGSLGITRVVSWREVGWERGKGAGVWIIWGFELYIPSHVWIYIYDNLSVVTVWPPYPPHTPE